MNDLAGLAADVDWPDHAATTAAHDALSTRPELGRLAGLVEWLAGAQREYPPHEITRARLVIFAGDRPLDARGNAVSGARPNATARAVAGIAQGDAPLARLARSIEAGLRVEEFPAGEEIEAAIERGAAVADAEIDAGADLLIASNIGTGSTTTAAAIVAVVTGTEPVKVTGRGGSNIDDTIWMHKAAAVRDARRQGWPHRSDPAALLAAIGSPDLAALTGFLLRAAARRTPVLLDGVVVAAAALLANDTRPTVARWWRAAQRTGDPGHTIALRWLDLEPILDLEMASGDGSAGLLALSLVRSALALSRSADV